MTRHNYIIELCKQNKSGTGLYLIESGAAAYIFIVTGNPTEAIRFSDQIFAESFIAKFPVERQRFMRIILLEEAGQEFKNAA